MRRARQVAAGIIAVLLVWWLVRGLDTALVAAAFRRASLGAIVLAVAMVLATLVIGAFRWQLLFPEPRPRLAQAFAVLVCGQGINVLMPFRLGEVVRVTELLRVANVPAPVTAGTIAVERILDVIGAGAAVTTLLITTTVPAWADAPGRTLVALGVSAAAGLPLLVLLAPRLLGKTRGRTRRWGEGLAAALVRLMNPARALALVALTAAIVGLAAATNYVVFRAFGLPVPFSASFLLLVALQVGGTLVPSPGNVGVFHAIVVLVLGTWAVERPDALACAVVLHLVALGPKVGTGACAARRQLGRSTRARARRADGEMNSSTHAHITNGRVP